MYDLHTHTYNSDGVLGPAELSRRCSVLGYRGLVISDHCDDSNLAETVGRVVEFCRVSGAHFRDMEVIPGCELTHIPPVRIAPLVEEARELGAAIVLVHGETIVEPVAGGTNRAAVEAGVDVLAHPGFITAEETALAAERGVRLEITARKGHSLTNGHVAALALEKGCRLSYGSDGHAPGDYADLEMVGKILQGAGLSEKQADKVMEDSAEFFS